MGKLVKKTTNSNTEVKAEVLAKALAYVTNKYDLGKEYVLTSFKVGKGVQVGVSSNEVDCVFSIVSSEVLSFILSDETTVEDITDLL